MSKKQMTRRALLTSVISLILCCAMLVGTTFAWFTDSVSSGKNQIVAGNLDIELEYYNGTTWEAVNADTNVFEEGTLWEPGHTEVVYLKVSNLGTLALKYNLGVNIASETGSVNVAGEKFNVSDFLKVASIEGVTTPYANREEARKAATGAAPLTSGYTKVGTLYSTTDANQKTPSEQYVALVVYMPEDVTNEANHKTGEATPTITLGINLEATQLVNENDSFGPDYDDEAFVPVADVDPLGAQTVNLVGGGTLKLDTSFSFKTTEDEVAAAASGYRYWHADFVVSADRDVPADSLFLAGYYEAYAQATNTEDQWIALSSDEDIAAGTAIRLLKDGMELSGNYEELCTYIPEFLCGVADPDGKNEGTTLKVELRLYETYSEEECEELFGYKSKNEETGAFKTIGVFEHTIGGEWVVTDNGAILFEDTDGSVLLYDVSDVEAAAFAVPEGVTNMGNGVFSKNTGIKTVTIPASVTDFGASGVSDTNASGGAFKDSGVTAVVLEEGITKIPAAAFNGAKNLTSVVIPASVQEIGVNAFRSTAITELVVPANVKNISYGAFRDMTSLTKVTFEGDHVDIPDYAFRGCTNLRQVYLNANTATIGSNMAFANASSNNPGTNNITFYVKSADIADQIKTCMGTGSYVAIYVNDALYAEIK